MGDKKKWSNEWKSASVQCLAFPGNYVTTGACKQLDLQILYLEQI